MKIAVDLDDVCMEFFSSVCWAIAEAFPEENLDPIRMYEETTDWVNNPVKDLRIFGEDIYGNQSTWWDWLKANDRLWAKFYPVHDSISGVRLLREAGHWVEAVTSKPQWAEWVVWEWQKQYQYQFNAIIIVPTGMSKLEASSADLLIDDRTSAIQEWDEAGRYGLLYTRPWNREAPGCKTWLGFDGVVDVVEQIDEQESA